MKSYTEGSNQLSIPFLKISHGKSLMTLNQDKLSPCTCYGRWCMVLQPLLHFLTNPKLATHPPFIQANQTAVHLIKLYHDEVYKWSFYTCFSIGMCVSFFVPQTHLNSSPLYFLWIGSIFTFVFHLYGCHFVWHCPN